MGIILYFLFLLILSFPFFGLLVVGFYNHERHEKLCVPLWIKSATLLMGVSSVDGGGKQRWRRRSAALVGCECCAWGGLAFFAATMLSSEKWPISVSLHPLRVHEYAFGV